nr:MAG TPA: hypothetical protein [Caudoviricetes sp.]
MFLYKRRFLGKLAKPGYKTTNLALPYCFHL